MKSIELFDSVGNNQGSGKTNTTILDQFMHAADMFRNSYIIATGILSGHRKLVSCETDCRQMKRESSEGRMAFEYDELLNKNSNIDLAHRKLERTLQRLKAKGIYETNMARLVTPILKTENIANIKGESSSYVWVIQNLISGIMQCGAKTGFTAQTVGEEDWIAAIETAVILHYPDEIVNRDIKSYAVHLDELASEIRLFAVLIHMVNSYEEIIEFCKTNSEEVSNYDKLKKKYADLSVRHEALIKRMQANPASKDDLSELDRVRAAAEKQQREDHTRIFALERQVELLSKEKALVEQLWADEIAAIKADEAVKEREPEAGSEAEIEAALTDEELYGHIELPEKNVLFLGGWPKLLRPIKERHPGWIFVNREDKGRGSDRIDIVFFFYEGISHKMAWRIYSEMRPDVKTIFIRQRNKGLMELEMKKGYAQLLPSETQELKNSGDEE